MRLEHYFFQLYQDKIWHRSFISFRYCSSLYSLIRFVFFSLISWHFCEKKIHQKSWIELATWHNCTVSSNFSSWRIWWGEGGGHCKPSPVSFMAEALETFGYFAFFIAQNITWTVICLFLDELMFTLLRIWGLSLGSQSLSPTPLRPSYLELKFETWRFKTDPGFRHSGAYLSSKK